jgi:hypothetical protein
VGASGAFAQEVTVAVGPGPHYVGSKIEVAVTAEGFDPRVAMRLEPAPTTSGTLSFVGESRQQSVTFGFGARQQMISTVVYTYELVPRAPGRAEIGPFTVSQGDPAQPSQDGVRISSPKLAITVLDLPLTDQVQIDLRVPSDTTYVGARLPVTLQYRVEPALHERVLRYVLSVPVADMTDDFRIEPERIPGGQALEIRTAAGRLELSATRGTETVDGQPWPTVTIPLYLTPRRPGLIAIGATSLTVEAGVRFVGDVFGRRRATQTERLRAADTPRTLRVRPVPLAGRPASFAGAVGRGFSLESAVDRSVVQVGDPITLELVLHGDGAIASVSLPSLDAEGLLPPGDFAVRGELLPGQMADGGKRFSSVIRVRHDGVREIPALAFSYFDPIAARFDTVYSRPIALSVRPAQIVGAADVVAPRAGGESGTSAPDGGAPGPPAGGRADGSSALQDLDLAIVADRDQLLAGPGAGGGVALPLACYVLSAMLVGAAFVARQRTAQRDSATARLAAAVAVEQARVEAAASRGDRAALAEIARSIRAIRALVPERDGGPAGAFLAACDALLYAPNAAAAGQPDARVAALCDQGRSVARAFTGEGA